MASWLPTEKQKRQWERFTEASRASAEVTSDMSGKRRMKARAAYMADELRGSIDDHFEDQDNRSEK